MRVCGIRTYAGSRFAVALGHWMAYLVFYTGGLPYSKIYILQLTYVYSLNATFQYEFVVYQRRPDAIDLMRR